MAAVFVPAEHPVDATFLLYRSDGGRLEPAAPAFPLRAAVRELVLPAEAGPVPRRVSAECWEVPVGLVLPLLAVPPHGAHPAVVGWARAARLALRLVTQKRVYPAVSEAGVDCWRIGPVTGALQRAVAEVAAALPPHAHCLLAGTSPYRITAPEVAVWSFLDAVAEAMVRTPGASALVGDAPYAAARPRSAPGLWPWADALEETWDAHRAPGMVLRIKNPDEAGGTGAEPVVPAALHLLADDGGQSAAAAALWDGTSCAPGLSAALLPAVRRTLRRAAASFTPLARLAAQKVPVRLELTGAELLHLHSGADRQLAEHGIAVDWPAGLLDALDAYAVLGTAGGDEASAAGGGRRVRGRLGLEELVDCRWQLTVDGQPLTEQEMDALAQAVLPLVRLRERWILLDSAMAKRARHRRLAPLPGAQALAAALSGHAPLDGTLVACRPAGALADLADSLRTPPETCTLVPPPTALNARLRAYQERALAWLARTTDLGFGALLADDMGLGKTLTVIALHLHRQQVGQAGPTLVVCPASLMANWERELARFAPATPVRRYHGPGRTLDDLPDGTVVITTYGTGRRDTDQLASLPWGLTVADEAQHIKNPAAATTQAMRSLRGTANVAVTGTPVENSLTDLWALLDWANPGLFGPLAAFRARYGRIERDPDHAAAGELARLLGPFMLRRRKSDPGIAPELPDKVHHQRIVTLTREQAGLYQALVDQTLEQVKASTGIARRGLVLKLLQCLRQICNTPAHYLKEPADQAAADPKAAAARSGKLAALDDLLTSLTARGEAALIFTSYVRMGHLLKAYLRGRGRTPYFLHGATPAGRRQELVDAFQHDANPAPVFILSVKAAGFGLNLIRAEHVIHYDRPWNPAVEDQATDRAHRIGQHRTVNVHHLTTEGTVEDHITALLERKRALGQAVLTSGETALAELDDAELAALVTLAGTR
ncbi:MAG: DEAD/DEAH box helicase [Actinobacteria bacterium]|nr:DEAD/DEAH box helicase [Actinomycetota bacterium]